MENIGDDNCDLYGLDVDLMMPDCHGEPQCPGGTVIPIVEDACVPQGDVLECPGADPRCSTPGDCALGTGYSSIADRADAMHALLPGFCPPMESALGEPRYLSACLLQGGTVLSDPPVPAGDCEVHVAEVIPRCDTNTDGAVDARDLALLLGDWGPCPDCMTDCDGDGVVDADDLALLLSQFD